MTRLYGSHVKRAEKLVAAIQEGRVTTQGSLAAWVYSATSLPVNLRIWVFEQVEGSIGPVGVRYLRSLLPAPVTEVHEAVELAIQCRKTHPEEPVKIWPKDGDIRLVVREAAH